MNDTSKLGPDMRDLMAAVGELLLTWGFLEQTIRDRIGKFNTLEAKPPTNASLMSQWQKAERGHRDPELRHLLANVKEIASIRNCIAHGLYSASADPWSADEPIVKCMTNKGDSLTFTYIQLEDTKRLIANAKNQIRLLDDPADP